VKVRRPDGTEVVRAARVGESVRGCSRDGEFEDRRQDEVGMFVAKARPMPAATVVVLYALLLLGAVTMAADRVAIGSVDSVYHFFPGDRLTVGHSQFRGR